eukprot:2474282-Pyramimonas_sp.AAC.1
MHWRPESSRICVVQKRATTMGAGGTIRSCSDSLRGLGSTDIASIVALKSRLLTNSAFFSCSATRVRSACGTRCASAARPAN